MIYQTLRGSCKTPKWAQRMVARSRQHACVIIDMLDKAKRDNARLVVKYKSKFPEIYRVDVQYSIVNGITISVDLLEKGNRRTIVEVVNIDSDGVLEYRISKWQALKRRMGKHKDDVSEFCLYFERKNKRASSFEFYFDPHDSPKLTADYYGSHEVSGLLLDDDPDDNDGGDEELIEGENQKTGFRFVKITN
jgi:hypothetical protein